MRAARILRDSMTVALALCLASTALPAEPSPEPASVRIDYPAEARVLGGGGGMGFVSGRVARESADIDLMLVIDVSASTRDTAGDVNGDGQRSPKREGNAFQRMLGVVFNLPAKAPWTASWQRSSSRPKCCSRSSIPVRPGSG